MRRKPWALFLLIGCLFVNVGTPCAEAGIVRGVQQVVAAVFALPFGVLQGTLSGPPIIGTLGGALSGTFRTVSLVTSGAMEIVSGAVPLAKAAAPFLLPFLFA